ncbi:hypothetical protein AKO1_004765 [Acrasis kona]|uniref:Uncharacterized protein n=1 Tax=Acrasis kona TaxID=1008807 RepID=A0AAW2Z6D7_9EUKA
MNTYKSIIALLVLIATVYCTDSTFVVGNGAGLFYKFDTTSQVATCINAAGSVVSTINLPCVPTSASITAVANVAVVTGIQAGANVIATVNLATGVVVNIATTAVAQIVAGVREDFVITASGLCYNRLSLNDFSASQVVICTPSPTRLLGLLDDETAVVVTAGASVRVGTFNIRAFADVSVSATVNILTGTISGTVLLARNGFIYVTSTAGVLTRYVVNNLSLVLSSSINLGVSGNIQLAADVCNNQIITAVGSNLLGVTVSQVNLNTFVAVSVAPINISLNLLGLLNINLGLNLGLNIGIRAAVSGSSLLLLNGNNNCCIGTSGGLQCNGQVRNSNLSLSSLSTCAIVNTGLNLGVSIN